MTTPIHDAIAALTKIKAATNRSPTTLAADVFLLASQGLAALQAEPAQGSIEVAGESKPCRCGIHGCTGRSARCLLRMSGQKHPPAPKASAPDAPAGDLPPLSSDLRIETYSPVARPQWTAHNDSGIRITHIPSGISAECHEDRNQHRNRAWAFEELCKKLEAARAAAAPAGANKTAIRENRVTAPAGHAEPVAWANVRESDGVVVGVSQHPEDIARWINPRPLVFAAPVAAEPAPAVPAQPGIDAHALLAKYMQHVVEVEGVYFVDGDCPDHLTESEWAALKAVAKTRRPAREDGEQENEK